MEKSFNLLDEPWLPVRLADGRIRDMSLLELFRRSDEIIALAETAPPSLVAQYRLLLAILHRALMRVYPQGWKDKDRAHWWRECLPIEAVAAYLEHWRERFWLFHPEHPFMQVAALSSCTETQTLYPPSTISLAQFYGTEMFNQEVYRDDSWSPKDVIKVMLGYFQFVPGGFFPGKKFKESEKAGALANTAAVIPIGENLMQTLLLCLHPWQAHEDLPAWERAALTTSDLRAGPVLASGPNDRYTRQSRAVLLRRESDGQVRWLHFAAGFALEEGSAPDPMASFREGSNGPVRLDFSEARALWRDLPALVPNPSGASRPAAVLSYAVALQKSLDPFDSVYQLLVAGLASDRARLLRWRAERIALPLALLEDAGKAAFLRGLVQKAEALSADLLTLATCMLAETMPESEHKDTRNRARSLLETGPFAASYFAQAERHLPNVLRQLGQGQSAEATQDWSKVLCDSAQVAWQQLVQGMGGSARALRADAKYVGAFHAVLRKHVSHPETRSTHQEAVA